MILFRKDYVKHYQFYYGFCFLWLPKRDKYGVWRWLEFVSWRYNDAGVAEYFA